MARPSLTPQGRGSAGQSRQKSAPLLSRAPGSKSELGDRAAPAEDNPGAELSAERMVPGAPTAGAEGSPAARREQLLAEGARREVRLRRARRADVRAAAAVANVLRDRRRARVEVE